MVKKILRNCLITVAIVAVCIVGFNCLNNHFEKHTEYKYTLMELDDGVFAVCTNVVSNVPAHNYEMITICCNGQIRTYKGRVSITYTDKEPYAIVRDYYNIVNNEEVFIYVPYGSVEFQSNVSIGSR